MTSLAVQRKEFSLFSRFAQERLVFHDNLTCPVMLLWKEHVRWATDNDYLALSAEGFMNCLREAGVYIKESGNGRLKRVADGVGVRPR